MCPHIQPATPQMSGGVRAPTLGAPPLGPAPGSSTGGGSLRRRARRNAECRNFARIGSIQRSKIPTLERGLGRRRALGALEGWGRRRLPAEPARAGPLGAEHVIGVGQAAPVEREAAAANALGELVAERLHLPDPVVEVGAPAGRDLRPVLPGSASARRAVARALPGSCSAACRSA